MKALIHVGSTKTGSSALQRFLADNRTVLEKGGICYPASGQVSVAYHLLAAELHPTAYRLHPGDLPGDRAERSRIFFDLAALIRREAEASRSDTVIVSSEYLWRQFDADVYAKWREAFEGMAVQVYAVIRRPDYWLQSCYLQALKHGESREFDAWYRAMESDPASGDDYLGVVTSWADGLDAESCTVRTYEWLLEGNALFSDLLRVAGFSASSGDVVYPKKVVNPSPGPEAADLLLRVNRSNLCDADKATIRRMILSSMESRQIGTALSFLSANWRRQILQSYVDQNLQIARNYAREIGTPPLQ